MRKSLRKVSAAIAGCALAMALTVSAVPNTASAGVQCSKQGEKAGKAKIDLDGTYHAYFGMQQQGVWIFRNSWFEPTLGKDGTNLEKNSYDSILKSGDNGVETIEGPTVTDAEINGNGTYTVSVEGLNSQLGDEADTANVMSLLFVSTDIPSSAIKDGSIKISDVKMSIDGREVFAGEPYQNADAEEWGLFEFDCVNTYQQDGYENPSVQVPKDSVKITFTVSGFNKDNPNAVEATPTPAADTTSDAASTDTSSETEDKGSSSTTIAIVAVVAVVVIAGVIVVVKKKKD